MHIRVWSPVCSVIELHETNRGLATKLKKIERSIGIKEVKRRSKTERKACDSSKSRSGRREVEIESP